MAGSGLVRLTLTNRDPERPLTLQAASWEEISKASDARTLRQNRGFYDLLALARMTGSIRIEPGQSLVTPPIAMEKNVPTTSGTIIWKVVAHDPAGKPCFGWAELPVKQAGVFPPRLADALGVDSPRSLLR